MKDVILKNLAYEIYLFLVSNKYLALSPQKEYLVTTNILDSAALHFIFEKLLRLPIFYKNNLLKNTDFETEEKIYSYCKTLKYNRTNFYVDNFNDLDDVKYGLTYFLVSFLNNVVSLINNQKIIENILEKYLEDENFNFEIITNKDNYEK